MSLYNEYAYNKKKKYLRNGLIILFLCIFAIITLFPIYFMIISAFGPAVEAGAVSQTLWPKKFTLDSFRFFFNYSKYSVRWLLNSLVVCTSVMVGNLVFASMAGYAFAKIRFKGKTMIFYVLLCAMMIPYQVTQVPLYVLMVNKLHMQNTYSSLILPQICNVFNIFLCKQFMGSIPTEIIECAKIEGCNHFKIFTKIAMPLSKTILAVMAITTFMDNWNTFFWPFLVTNKLEMQTIQVGLKNFSFANTTYFGPMMAGATVAAVPMFILFFSLQKYFLEGVTVGAVKG